MNGNGTPQRFRVVKKAGKHDDPTSKVGTNKMIRPTTAKLNGKLKTADLMYTP